MKFKCLERLAYFQGANKQLASVQHIWGQKSKMPIWRPGIFLGNQKKYAPLDHPLFWVSNFRFARCIFAFFFLNLKPLEDSGISIRKHIWIDWLVDWFIHWGRMELAGAWFVNAGYLPFTSSMCPKTSTDSRQTTRQKNKQTNKHPSTRKQTDRQINKRTAPYFDPTPVLTTRMAMKNVHHTTYYLHINLHVSYVLRR